MTTFQITIPDSVAARVADGFAARHGYENTVIGPDGVLAPNPETKQIFLKRKVIAYIRESAQQAEIAQATQDAGTQAAASADRELSF